MTISKPLHLERGIGLVAAAHTAYGRHMAQTGAGPRGWLVEDLARFVRLFAMGATLLYPLVGIAVTPAAPAPAVVARAIVLGIAFHVSGAVANDVCDLPIDRTDPRRQAGPLVTGRIAPTVALAFALALLAPAFATLAGLPGSTDAARSLALGCVLGTVYNVAGKDMPIPFVADLLQGVAWAMLVVVGAGMAGPVEPGVVAWPAVFVVAYVAVVNGVSGAIRDLDNDRAAGARTTAVLLGARITSGAVQVPAALVGYGAVLQVALGVALVGTVAAAWRPGASATVAVAVAGVVFGAASVQLVRAYRARTALRCAMAAGTWHLFLTPAALLASISWRLPPWAAAVGLAAFVAPPLAFGAAVRGTAFGVPGSRRDPAGRVAPWWNAWRALWRSCRPGVPATAAGLVVVGALLGGGAPGTAAPAAAATALVVAATNVFTDRCDVVADRVNRPDRPLPSGALRASDADRCVLALGVAGVAMAALVSAVAAAAVAVLLAVGLAYPLLRRAGCVAGPLVVAGLFAATVPFGGAVAAESLSGRHAAASVMVLTFVVGREVLKSVPDIDGDRAAGYPTVATRFGAAVAVRWFRLALAVHLALVAAWMPRSAAGAGYVVALALCVLPPATVTLWHLRGAPDTAAVQRGIDRSGLLFAGGLIALLLV